MKRIMIVGQPGAGKSTLATILGTRTGLPVVHIDKIHWMPGWNERPKAEKISMMRQAEKQPEWIIEGGLSQTWDSRVARADLLIVLAFPLWLRAWRVFRRTLLHHGQSRPDLPANCPERFDREFWVWIWSTRRTGREKMFELANRVDESTKVEILRSPGQVSAFLGRLDK